MSTIHLKDIKVFTNHGCLPEEEKIGSNYLVNMWVKTDLKKAAKSDLLIDTVDYVHLNAIVKKEMAVRSKLLEHVGQRIIDTSINEIPKIKKIKVTVSKINPPIGGDVSMVSVTISGKKRPKKE